MDSQQLSGKATQSVQPKDLIYSGGNWRRPTEQVPTAELISATSFNISGRVDINRRTKKAVVEFDLSKTSNNFGWEGANVHISIILPQGGQISHRVQPQFDAMRPNVRARVRAEFQWGADLIGILFILSDGTSQSKGGLVVHGVTVQEMYN